MGVGSSDLRIRLAALLAFTAEKWILQRKGVDGVLPGRVPGDGKSCLSSQTGQAMRYAVEVKTSRSMRLLLRREEAGGGEITVVALCSRIRGEGLRSSTSERNSAGSSAANELM